MADIEAAPAAASPHAPPKRMAADAVIFGFLTTLWLSNAANATAIAVRWAFGEGSRATAFARGFAMASSLTMGLLLVASLLLLLRRCASRDAVAREIGGDEGTKKPATLRAENTGGCRDHDGLCGPVTKPIVVFFVVLIAVGVLMEELAPAKGSCAYRIGSMLTDIGFFLTSVLFCLVIFPKFIIHLRAQSTKVNSS